MNNINLKNKNSSLFTNFVKNVVHNPSEVQKNFMDISLKIAETIRKYVKKKTIFEVPYNGKNIGNKVKIINLVLWMEVYLVQLNQVQNLCHTI